MAGGYAGHGSRQRAAERSERKMELLDKAVECNKDGTGVWQWRQQCTDT